jgi:hypothetical protein
MRNGQVIDGLDTSHSGKVRALFAAQPGATTADSAKRHLSIAIEIGPPRCQLVDHRPLPRQSIGLLAAHSQTVDLKSLKASHWSNPVGNLEKVAACVTHHCPAVAIWRIPGFLYTGRARAQSTLISGISIIDVHVEEGREYLTLTGL